MPVASVHKPALAPEEQLHSGDRMSRQEFHRLYEKMGEDFKAELVGGIVHVAPALRLRHGTNHPYLSGLLFVYQGSTPGVELGDNTTVLLGDEGEPQPDLLLRVLPEYGGQSTTSPDDYVEGPPELVAEIAHSSRSIDLNAIRDDYTRYGVLEYLVVNLADHRLHWLDLRTGQELSPDPDGVVRMRCYPGLWIHADALLAKDYGRLMATLQQGLASPEHADFVRRLADARREQIMRKDVGRGE
jgi:Uma2 family endonuclease